VAVIVPRIESRLPGKLPDPMIVLGTVEFAHALLLTISFTPGDRNFTLRNKPADCFASFAALRAMRRASSRSMPYASKIAARSIATNVFRRDCAAFWAASVIACVSVIEWATRFVLWATVMKRVARIVALRTGRIAERKPAAHKLLAFNDGFHGGQ
jgi:hypothetical protein